MKKFFALIFVVSYFLTSYALFAATVNYEFDNEKYSCEEKTDHAYKCKSSSKEVLVLRADDEYVLFENMDPMVFDRASKIVKNNKLISNHPGVLPNTLAIKKMLSEFAMKATAGSRDEYLKKASEDAKNFYGKTSEYYDNVRVAVGNNEVLQCTRGSSKKLTRIQAKAIKETDSPRECTYYSCTGNDPDEKILFYMPPLGSSAQAPFVLGMKNGQARFMESKFTIHDDTNNQITKVKNAYSFENREIRESFAAINTPLDPKLLVPSKYNESASSFNYLTNPNSSGEVGFRMLCDDKKITELSREQNKIAKEMRDYLSYADIVTYVTSLNGDIKSYYIDREKASQLGCSFQDKILDAKVLPELQRLQDLSAVRPQDKYPTEKEIQKLFVKALRMKDIPFEYKYDGCYARAHLMARRFEEMGYKVKKAWIKGDLSIPGTDVTWDYHVAPLIEGKDANGNIVQYVIDPSLNDEAVTLDEWAASMTSNSSAPILKTTYPVPENGADFNRTVVAVSSSDPYSPSDRKYVTEDQRMEDAAQVMREYTQVVENNKKKGNK